MNGLKMNNVVDRILEEGIDDIQMKISKGIFTCSYRIQVKPNVWIGSKEYSGRNKNKTLALCLKDYLEQKE